MYSTKLINKNIVDKNAYITVGDPYNDPKGNPFRLSKKGEKLVPFQVKMKPQNEENGNFGKLKYAECNYLESTKYLDTQPLENRKLGFGSHDAKRRDEFANAIRTEQQKTTIMKERKVMERTSGDLPERLTQLLAERQKYQTAIMNESEYSKSVPLYDIGRTRVTAFDPKLIKDTYYKFNHNHDKRRGDYRPCSTEFGDGAWNVNYKPPQYGGSSVIRNFFDKSHLTVGNMA